MAWREGRPRSAKFAKNEPTLASGRYVEQLVAGSHGVDIPPYEKLRNFRTWAEEKPPAERFIITRPATM
jgi:hypothetical protein